MHMFFSTSLQEKTDANKDFNKFTVPPTRNLRYLSIVCLWLAYSYKSIQLWLSHVLFRLIRICAPALV
jgi:hypothetical protein